MKTLTAVAASALAVACTMFGGVSQASAGGLGSLNLGGVIGSITDPLLEPCDKTGITQRFADWGDSRYYVPAPGGSFEDGAPGWNLGGGVSFSGNGNSYGTSGGALQLDGGETVTSPPICVSLDYSVSRMFAKLEKGKATSSLNAEVLYRAPITGATKSKSTTLGVEGSGWNPTATWSMPVLSQIINTDLSGQPVEVKFRFTASAGSRWLIDDVWVDPRMRR